MERFLLISHALATRDRPTTMMFCLAVVGVGAKFGRGWPRDASTLLHVFIFQVSGYLFQVSGYLFYFRGHLKCP